MTPELKTKKKGKRLIFIYYSCTNSKGICKRQYVPEQTLLDAIYAVFEQFKGIPKVAQDKLVVELRKANESEVEFHQQELDRIRTEYDRTQNRIQTLLDLYLDASITKPDYDKKLQELKDKQNNLNIQLEEHTKADHEYHIHAATVLNLARRMKEIFEGSEPNEKRAILNFMFQNSTVSGKTPDFPLKKAFSTILHFGLTYRAPTDEGD